MRIFSIVAMFFWQFNILHYPQNLDGLPSGYFDRWFFLRDHSIEITTTQTIQHYLTVFAKFLLNWSKLGIRLISLFGKSCWGNFFPSSVSEPAFFLFLPQKTSQSPSRFLNYLKRQRQVLSPSHIYLCLTLCEEMNGEY